MFGTIECITLCEVLYCAKHKLTNMIDVKATGCQHDWYSSNKMSMSIGWSRLFDKTKTYDYETNS
jgi:hypothetical protein